MSTPIQVGAIGRTVSRLYPSGQVEIAGRRHDARSEGQPLEADTAVIVIGGDGFGLLVRPLQAGEESRLANAGRAVE